MAGTYRCALLKPGPRPLCGDGGVVGAFQAVVRRVIAIPTLACELIHKVQRYAKSTSAYRLVVLRWIVSTFNAYRHDQRPSGCVKFLADYRDPHPHKMPANGPDRGQTLHRPRARAGRFIRLAIPGRLVLSNGRIEVGLVLPRVPGGRDNMEVTNIATAELRRMAAHYNPRTISTSWPSADP